MKLLNSPLLKSQTLRRLGTGQRSGSNSGQALIEYLLIVIISVTLVTSLAVSIFRPLGQFINDLNRKYVQCLLETGELPQLSSQEQGVICFDELPSFAGVDENGNPLGSGTDDGGRLDKKDALATRDGQTTNAGGGSGAGGSGRGSGGGRLGRSGRAGTESRPRKVTTIPVSQEFDEGSGFFSSSNGGGGGYRIRRKKQRQIAIASMTEYDRRNLEKTIERTSSVPVSADEGFTTPRKKKVSVKPPPPKKTEEDLKVDVGFGKYFKIFFLIIFILFVVIVFGGQAFQISKNWGNN